jgi:hypothetical protein
MDIKKIYMFLIALLFVGCNGIKIVDNYTHDKSVDKYFNSKYKNELEKNDIKIIKCSLINDKIIPMYYDKFVVNTYNSLIYIKYLNNVHGYSVYFDSSYKFKNKQEFLSDLDTCMKTLSKIEENKKSWK